MNRIGRKELAPDAARLFEGEVLELTPDIPRKELCDLVYEYVYYQTDGMTRSEADTIVDKGCREAAVREP